MLKISLLPGKGRGTVSTQSINKGELIEAAPACAFPPEQRKFIDETTLSEYHFVRPSEYSLKEKCVNGYIVFGLSSLCNHSETPNAEVKWAEDDTGLWARLTATEDIRSGEEVTIFYTNIDEYSLNDKFI